MIIQATVTGTIPPDWRTVRLGGPVTVNDRPHTLQQVKICWDMVRNGMRIFRNGEWYHAMLYGKDFVSLAMVQSGFPLGNLRQDVDPIMLRRTTEEICIAVFEDRQYHGPC